jgi:hypothetical protein
VPPAFSPAAIPAPFADFKITDSQFKELESAGGIKLSHDHRRAKLGFTRKNGSSVRRTHNDFWLSDRSRTTQKAMVIKRMF